MAERVRSTERLYVTYTSHCMFVHTTTKLVKATLIQIGCSQKILYRNRTLQSQLVTPTRQSPSSSAYSVSMGLSVVPSTRTNLLCLKFFRECCLSYLEMLIKWEFTNHVSDSIFHTIHTNSSQKHNSRVYSQEH